MNILRVLPLLFLVSCAMGEDSPGIANAEATARLGPEIVRLQKRLQLKREVSVVVLDKRVYGWTDDDATRRIIIVDKGHEENVRTLRHEMEHCRQLDYGEPIDEEKARAAERHATKE